MRVPIFVPLILMIASASLFAVDIVSVVNATREPDAYHVTHSDDNQTFVAAVLVPLEPGEELRVPDAGGWVIVSREPGPQDMSPITLSNGSNGSIHATALTNNSLGLVTLLQRGEYLIIPAWQLDRLAAGLEVSVLYESRLLHGLRFTHDALPPASEEDVHGWPGSLAVVWRLQNDTEDYALAAQTMQERGASTMPEMYAVDGGVVARDPWMRAAAVTLAAAAVVLAVLPGRRTERAEPPRPPAGASLELAAAGRTFLASIRNAYLALAAAVAVLGIPLMLFLGLFAKNATGPAGHLEFIGTGDPWEGTVWLQMLFLLVAGVLTAARPAVDAELALRRWRRAEDAAPIEGDLGP